MYEVFVSKTFSASHQLTLSTGQTESLHPHQWRVEVLLESGGVNVDGIAIDFNHVEEKLTQIISQLESRVLNRTEPFSNRNPSAENIARFVFGELKKDPGLVREAHLKKVTVWEQEDAGAAYWE